MSDFADYLLFMAGALAFLLLIVLFSLLQVSYLPENVTEVVTLVLFLPLIMDLMLISPSLPMLLLFFFMVPLLLTLVVIFRIALAKILKVSSRSLRLIARKMPQVIRRREERKYGLKTLLAVSTGATIGPSTFVLSPYSVKYYGWYALPGMVLASLSSVALAYGYSNMYYYSKKIGGKIVGGPSFVGNAFGVKHYLYIISRFTMWIGNVALAAFNLLIVLGLVSEYVLPVLVQGLVQGWLSALVKVVLFIVLSLVVLAVYKHWEKMVDLQIYLAFAFLLLFGVHVFMLVQQYHVHFAFPTACAGTFGQGLGFLHRFIMGVLMSAAYVYLMVFGFQEVQSLGENVETRSGLEDEVREVSSILKRAMVGGALFSSVVFCFYIAIYVALYGSGVEIPETTIPALDLAKVSQDLYAVTFAAITLGIMTTYVPAFVAALKHLRELISDVFLVRVEELGVQPDPFIVILFMGFLLLTNARYIIHLTDFAVLISLGIIAFSERHLRRKAFRKARSKLVDDLRIYLLTAVIMLITFVFAATSSEVAVNSVFFMVFSTLIIMFLSYDLFIVELFTIAMGILSLILSPPLIGVISEFASYGIATPTDVAIAHALVTSLWIFYFIFSVLVIHMVVEHGANIINLVKALATLIVKLLYSLFEKTKKRSAKIKNLIHQPQSNASS